MSDETPLETVRGVALRAAVFVAVLLGGFVGVCAYIDRFQPPPAPDVKGISAERGRAIFWGKGQCSACHQIEGKGTAIRGPNLGEWPERKLPAIGARAEARAAERRAQGKEGMTAAQYLVESVTQPQAYLVEGFGPAMPVVWRPPIALGKEELLSVLLFLESQDGEPDAAALRLPPEVERGIEEVARGGGRTEEMELPFKGDPRRGRALFFDEDDDRKGVAACIKCHSLEVDGKKVGGQVGPELTGVAARQPLSYLMESVLQPSKVIVAGFEPWQVELKPGGAPRIGVKSAEDAESITLGMGEGARERIAKADIARMFKRQDWLRVRRKSDRSLVVGLKVRETADEIALEEKVGKLHTVPKADIASVDSVSLSIMPGNFAEVLTAREFFDIIEFLRTLR